MTTANTRITIGALLGAVTTSANAVSQTLNVITDGIDMAQNTVSTLKANQIIRNKVDVINYENNYIEQAAQVRAGQKMQIQEFRKKSSDHATAFDAALDEIQKALNPTSTQP